MVSWAVFWERTLHELLLLLNAPRLEPSMWWVVAPLAMVFVVMTFYFGLYKKEELGWNTALGNTIVLLFIAIDLLRTIYNYTIPPSFANFGIHFIKFVIIFIIIIEAILLFYSAFAHALPKKVMFFIASPLPVNLQAYVITSIVYLRVDPTVYTLLAAVLFFILLFVIAKVLQLLQRVLVEESHKKRIAEAQELRKEARELRKKAKKAKGEAAKELREKAKKQVREAKNLEQEVIIAEQLEHGELRAAKELKKARKKKQ